MYKKRKRKREEWVGGRKSRDCEKLPNKIDSNGMEIRWAEAVQSGDDEKLPDRADRTAGSAWSVSRPPPFT